MSTEYSFFGLDYEESVSSDSQKICWKTKYCQLLHEYEELLCCFHCHVQNMNSTMKEDEADEVENPSIINILKQKNLHLVNTIMGLQREIKYKVPMGPPLHPVHDMSLNAPRFLHIYSHPAYAHKYHPHRPHHPHPYPKPYPHPYHHRDISMNIPHHIYPHPIPIPHHPTTRPIMPQNAHIPPPIIKHPHPSTPPLPEGKNEIKPLNKDILNYPYLYPYGGYPYGGYPYGYGYPYYSSYYPYYRGLEDREVDLPTAHPPGGVKKPRPPPHPPLHPVLHPVL